jgi:DNA-binding NarL/FixJ family response regulator
MEFSDVVRPGTEVRVLLVDDSRVIRDGLAQILRGHRDIDIVGQAADGMQAVDMALQLKPDVILMDISMPGLNGIEATRHIRRQLPDVRIIGLSTYTEDEFGSAMVGAGASDYLSKTALLASLVSKIRKGRVQQTSAVNS